MCTGAMLCVSMGPNIWLTMAHPNQAMACDIPHSSCKPVTGPSPKYCLDIKQIGSNIDTHYIIITYINESSHWPALSFWWDSPIFCKDIRHHPLALATTQNLVLKDEHRVAVTSVAHRILRDGPAPVVQSLGVRCSAGQTPKDGYP